MANNPQYVGAAKSPSVVISTANTNRDGTTGTYGTLITAGASGSRVDAIHICATSSTTAGMLRLFVGTALVAEVPVTAVSPSAVIPVWSAKVEFSPPLVLQASAVLKISTHNAESFVATVTNGGDF